MTQATVTTSMRALAAIYRRDPKRAGLITAATVAMLGLSVRMMFGGPTQASAMARDAGSEVLRRPGSSESLRPGVTGKQNEAARVDPGAWTQWLNTERHAPRRNLFAADGAHTPAPAVTGVTVSQSPAQIKEVGGIWDEVAKSMATQADQNRERQQSHLAFLRRQGLQRQAGELQLTQYVPGPPPAAWVNGELVGEGSVVASFRVLKIEPRRIIVEREGIQLEIPLNQATMPK